MKKRITVTIDEGTFKALHLQNKNVSGYINELLGERVIGTHKERLVERIISEVKDRLLADEVFFSELAYRLNR